MLSEISSADLGILFGTSRRYILSCTILMCSTSHFSDDFYKDEAEHPHLLVVVSPISGPPPQTYVQYTIIILYSVIRI